MSYFNPMDKPYVGQVVYRHCLPQSPGRIVEVGAPVRKGYFIEVKVKWLKTQEVTKTDTSYLKDFHSLIQDHEKKLNTHKKMLARVLKEVAL